MSTIDRDAEGHPTEPAPWPSEDPRFQAVEQWGRERLFEDCIKPMLEVHDRIRAAMADDELPVYSIRMPDGTLIRTSDEDLLHQTGEYLAFWDAICAEDCEEDSPAMDKFAAAIDAACRGEHPLTIL